MKSSENRIKFIKTNVKKIFFFYYKEIYLPPPGPDFSPPEEAEIYKVPTPYVGIK
jgi:hypothetical protein